MVKVDKMTSVVIGIVFVLALLPVHLTKSQPLQQLIQNGLRLSGLLALH